MKRRITNQERNIAAYRHSDISYQESSQDLLEQDLAEYREDLLQPFDLVLDFIKYRQGTNTKLNYTVSLSDIECMLEKALKEGRGSAG